MDELGDTMTQIMDKFGIVQNSPDNDISTLNRFNAESKRFMKSTPVEIWGDPIKFSDLGEFINLSPLDLANLDWLIIEDEAEIAKTAGA